MSKAQFYVQIVLGGARWDEVSRLGKAALNVSPWAWFPNYRGVR